ncbi:MAG: sigma-54 dependent transcriptional regulator [Spirochaetaceae bacterium]|nr:sigma-54 dependent transcriptional regulator [Spirochaetaceae bacterium]MCF7947159.1 sigma-54 dependent transcriptional regulator [Spirochaetia bacterium]MCF7950024.1 sigma-54 dependent transcriptional regulator [Spirochaetaceae bacterium]
MKEKSNENIYSGFTVFCIDDEEESLSVYKRTLRKIVDNLRCFQDAKQALGALNDTPPDLILLDLCMPRCNGHQVLEMIQHRNPGIPVYMVTGRATIRDAVKAIKQGAKDLIEKPITNELLVNKVSQVKRTWELEQEMSDLRRRTNEHFHFDGLIGNSEPMLRLKKTIVNVGHTDMNVLIQGETGTGKELVARAIHAHSERKDNPFTVVDCGAINGSVIESELFGYRKGSFTGATHSHNGLIQEADGGTVFFDEIGELPLALQTKLLRLVQEQEVRPIGATTPVSVNIRILAATNRNLQQAVEQGEFREDLYYRFNTITINVPALRERTEDIEPLLKHFLSLHLTDSPEVTRIEDSAMTRLLQYAWPGNVRELQNVVRRAIVFAEPPQIQMIDLPEAVRNSPAVTERRSDEFSIESYEQQAIQRALDQTWGNKKQAAKLLGIAEATLHRKLKRLDFNPE